MQFTNMNQFLGFVGILPLDWINRLYSQACNFLSNLGACCSNSATIMEAIRWKPWKVITSPKTR